MCLCSMTLDSVPHPCHAEQRVWPEGPIHLGLQEWRGGQELERLWSPLVAADHRTTGPAGCGRRSPWGPWGRGRGLQAAGWAPW